MDRGIFSGSVTAGVAMGMVIRGSLGENSKAGRIWSERCLMVVLRWSGQFFSRSLVYIFSYSSSPRLDAQRHFGMFNRMPLFHSKSLLI